MSSRGRCALALPVAIIAGACGAAPSATQSAPAAADATATPVVEASASTADVAPESAAPESRMAGLTYVAGQDGRDLVVIDAAGEPQRIFEGPDEPWGDLYHPRWSPDGSQLFVSLGYAPGNTWIMDADGGNERRLEVGDCGVAAPERWSADGRSVLFTEFVEPGLRHDVPKRCILDLASGDVEVIEPPAYGQWLSDGSTLVFATEAEGQVAYLVDAVSGGRTRLLAADSVSWAPDGDRLAYTRWHPSLKLAEVGLADGDGRNAEPIGEGKLPTWSPDGRFVAYLEPDGPDGLVARLHVVTDDGVAVADTEATIHPGWPLVWLPDSSGLVVEDGTTMFLVTLDGAVTRIGAGRNPTWRPQDP